MADAEHNKPGHPGSGEQHASFEQRRPVRVLVSELLEGGREAILEHAGQDYRLRITSNGKLILTK